MSQEKKYIVKVDERGKLRKVLVNIKDLPVECPSEATECPKINEEVEEEVEVVEEEKPKKTAKKKKTTKKD